MKQRILSALLAVCLLHSSALAVEGSRDHFVRTHTYSGQFSDLAADDPLYENVAALYEYGLSTGKLDGTFGLKDSVTVSQVLIFAGRLRSLYRTGDPEAGPAACQAENAPVHAAYLAYLKAEGVVGTELDDCITAAATRAQVAHILARTLPEEELPLINDAFVTEAYATRVFLTDVTEYTPYQADILFLYRAGIVGGSDDTGSFLPDAAITRGALAAVLTRMADTTLRLHLDWAPVLYEGMDLTLGDLVAPGTYIAAPGTRTEMDESIRFMLSSDTNTLDLHYPGISLSTAREKMQEALGIMKHYCEQGYNSVSCALSPDGSLRLSFSTEGAGDRSEEYRSAAMQAAIAVHDQLWSSRRITHSMTETEKARVYYDWVCANCTYDTTAGDTSLSHTAYQLFTSGTAVCDGYTGAYNLLLKLEGISCGAVYSADHIWTAAQLDGETVHIDTTWGDADDVIDDGCFAMTLQESWAMHPWQIS